VAQTIHMLSRRLLPETLKLAPSSEN